MSEEENPLHRRPFSAQIRHLKTQTRERGPARSGQAPCRCDSRLHTDKTVLGHRHKLATFRSLDVAVLTPNISCRVVVANREERRSARVRAAGGSLQVAFTSRWVAKLRIGTWRSARGGVAPNGSSCRPDHLSEMTPTFELTHVWVVIAPLATVLVEFVIVKTVGENTRDIARCNAVGNILAISSTTRCTSRG